MATGSDRRIVTRTAERAEIDVGLRNYMLRVYNYMASGLALTGLAGWVVANTALRDVFFNYIPEANAYAANLLGMIVMFSPLAVYFLFHSRIRRMSLGGAQAIFWLFATLFGLSIASILLNFTGESVARVFFITAGAFGAMSLYGYTTKRDLSSWFSFLFMGLIGLIIAMVVNMFIGSTMMMYVISVIGVIVFVGLTAYDTQRVKSTYLESDSDEVTGKKAVFGALSLYLDFLNLFMFLMILLGQRR